VLTERYAKDELARHLLPLDEFHPYPTADDRAAWEGLPAALRKADTAAAEARLGMEWPSLPATVFMQFRRDGNRSNFEELGFERRSALNDLVIGECQEAEGRFVDDIINGLWCTCEESFWGVPAHSDSSRFPGTPLPDTADRIIDLFAGETAGLLAWTCYLLRTRLDAVHPVICDRIQREMQERIIGPYLARDDYWWMGLETDAHGRSLRSMNNWTPWCVSNCLTAVLLMEPDRERRLAAVLKALRSLDRFLEVYHSDGGCDEGPSYWGRAGASMFDCLNLLWQATGGLVDVWDEPLIQNMGRYIYRVHIAGDWFVNFADCPARVGIPAHLVYLYGRRIGDDGLVAMGAGFHREQSAAGRHLGRAAGLLRRLPATFATAQVDALSLGYPYVRDVWMEGLQVMTAREREGSAEGLFLAAKGGHNAESHNHNDVGQFIVYHDGQPVLVDAGVERYTAKTFSPQRYEIWTMQSAYHNLPTIGGLQQVPGHTRAAAGTHYEMDDSVARLRLDIAPAYPQEARLSRWNRTCELRRGGQAAVLVRDCFELAQAIPVTLSLMTPREPTLEGDGTLRLRGDTDVIVTYDADALEAAVESIDIADERLQPAWGGRLYRVLLKSRGPVDSGDWELRVEAG